MNIGITQGENRSLRILQYPVAQSMRTDNYSPPHTLQRFVVVNEPAILALPVFAGRLTSPCSRGESPDRFRFCCHPSDADINSPKTSATSSARSAEWETPRPLPPLPNRIAMSIVDDNENDRFLTTRAVDQSPGLESVGAYSSGVEALKGIPSSVSKVVLIDVRMPTMSGIELARRLKKIRPHLVIIMITGFDHPDTRAQSLEAGADAYLTKPFSIERFLETLRDCLRRRESGADESGAPRAFRFVQTKETRSATISSFLRSSDQRSGRAIRHQKSGAEAKRVLLIDEPTVRRVLRRIVFTFEENLHAREDLLQEALVHLWSMEQRHPGQRLAWYLKGVKYHLQHLRTSGRSLDSPRHRAARAESTADPVACNERPDTLKSDDGIMSEVNAHDVFSLLVEGLEPIDQRILVALAAGLKPCEIAETLQISPQSILRHRQTIADLAIKLGVVPPRASPNPDGPTH